MTMLPRIIYGHAGDLIQVDFTLPSRFQDHEEGVIGFEDITASGVPVLEWMRHDRAFEVILRFTEQEYEDVIDAVKWMQHFLWVPVVVRLDAEDEDSEFEVYLEAPPVGQPIRPRRNPQSVDVWELPLTFRRVFVPEDEEPEPEPLTPEEALVLGLGDTDNPLTTPLVGWYTSDLGPRVDADGRVPVWDDRRCNTVNGRLALVNSDAQGQYANMGSMTALNAITKATFGVWYMLSDLRAAGDFQTIASRWHVSSAVSQQFLMDHNGSAGGPRFVLGSGAGLGIVAHATPPVVGVWYKMFWVFDGSLVGNTNRLKLWRAEWNPLTQTWGAVVQLALVSITGTVPAAFITSAAAVDFIVGNFAGHTNSQALTGLIDELRIWTGRSLTQAEMDAETLSVTDAPNFRYTFAGDANNTGSTVGNNGVLAGNATYSSDDLQWTPLVATRRTWRPTWNGTDSRVEFDGVDDKLFAHRGILPRITPDYAMAYVGSLPSGATTRIITETSQGATIMMSLQNVLDDLRVQGSPQTLSMGVSGSTMPNVRVFHGRRTAVVAGNNLVGGRLGNSAEQTSASGGAGADITATQLSLGVNRSGSNPYAAQVKALLLYLGADYTSGNRYQAVNTYAVDRHGATL